MGKNVKITKLKKADLKLSKLKKGPNSIKKIVKPIKINKDKDQELLSQLNINIGETLQQELEKLNLAATKIEEEKKRKKEVELKNFLSTYGRDYDKKLIVNVEESMTQIGKLSKGQRKRLAQKEKVARRKLLALQAEKAKGHVQLDLKPFKFKKPKDLTKNPSIIEKSIEEKMKEEMKEEEKDDVKMVIGLQRKSIKKNKKRKSKLAKTSIKE